jgi:hypothetical protein
MHRLLLVASALALAACSNFRDTFTGRADVAAEAGSLKLTPDRLAKILTAPRGIRVNQDLASFVSNLWVDYALFAQAAAAGKLPTDSAGAAQALWPEVAELRTGHWHDSIVARRPVPTGAAADSVYQGDEVRVFQHILVGSPAGAKPEAKTAARKKAEATLVRLRKGADFGRVAAEVSDDPGSKRDSGFLPPSPRGRFVPAFDSAGWKLGPGAMTGVVETQFGYHIIKRPPPAAVHERLIAYLGQTSGQRSDSTYMEDLARSSGLRVAKDAPAQMKASLADPERSRTSKKELAAFAGGGLTVGEFLTWIRALPPQYNAQLKQANDTNLAQFARVLSLNLLLLRQADSAKIGLTSEEWNSLYTRYTASLDSLKTDIGVGAADSSARGGSVGEKVDGYFQRVVAGQVRLRQMPSGLGQVLRQRNRYRINDVGIGRGLELALAQQAKADSAAGTATAPAGPLQRAPGPPPVPGQSAAPADSAPGKQP